MKTRTEWVTAAQIEAGRRVKFTEAGFEAGFIEGVDWMFRQQLLQQAECNTQLPLLTDTEYEKLIKALYPADNRKIFRR